MSNYLTLAQLKASKTKDGTTLDVGSYTDAELQAIIDEAEALIELLTHDRFYSFTATYYFSGNGKTHLFFPPDVTYELLSITGSAITEVDFDQSTVLETFTEDDDFRNEGHFLEINYETSDIRRVIGKKGVWPVGQQNMKVAGTWGWSSTPALISRATKLLCQERIEPTSTGMAIDGIRRIEWEDFEIEFAANDGETITGYREVDKILENYINYSTLFVSTLGD